MMDDTNLVDKDRFNKVASSDLNEENKYLAGWYPNSIIDSAQTGKSRPWTKEGRKAHSFAQDFFQTLKWYKLEKIARFEQKAWNLDQEIVQKIKKNFQNLISVALDEVDKNQVDVDNADINIHEYLSQYDTTTISEYTATDYLFQNITNREIKNVLDFGSGIARQSLQWSDKANFISVDAIESLYILQNKIYSILFPERLKEYFIDPENFEVNLNERYPNLFHLPTWKLNLIPDNSLDLIICVQVLNEIDEKTVRYVIRQFKRMAKKNCVLYVRDNEGSYEPGLNIRVGRLLLEEGFEVVYRYQGLQTDLEGTPRVWSNTGYKSTFKKRILRSIDHPNTYGKFHMRTIMKTIYYKIKDLGLPI